MTEIDPGTRMMGAVPPERGGLGTPPPKPEPDPHAERAAREGISRDEAKRRNMIDAYNANQPQHPMPVYQQPMMPYPPSFGPNYSAGPQANSSVVNQIRIGGAYRPFNHGFHLMLTVLTCGLWAPVWVIAWALHPKGQH
jgi:hypothetical protein